MVDSSVAGLVLGAAYLRSGRTQWATVLAHGSIDAFGLVAWYLGPSD